MIAAIVALALSRITREMVLDTLVFIGIVAFVLFAGTIWAWPA